VIGAVVVYDNYVQRNPLVSHSIFVSTNDLPLESDHNGSIEVPPGWVCGVYNPDVFERYAGNPVYDVRTVVAKAEDHTITPQMIPMVLRFQEVLDLAVHQHCAFDRFCVISERYFEYENASFCQDAVYLGETFYVVGYVFKDLSTGTHVERIIRIGQFLYILTLEVAPALTGWNILQVF